MSQAERQWELDALRGLMLVLMTITHLPTRLAYPLGQPFGFVSAAEGFVLLSAYMAGRVYSAKADAQGPEAMKNAFFNRALKGQAHRMQRRFFCFKAELFFKIIDQQLLIYSASDSTNGDARSSSVCAIHVQANRFT